MFDRNFEEMCSIWNNESLKENSSYPSKKLFSGCKSKLTYKGNYEWDIHYNYGETIRHKIEICAKSLNTNWDWIPLNENNEIVIDNDILIEGLPKLPHKNQTIISIDKFPDLTRVGWRGPMILWKYIESFPDTYF